MKNWILSLAVLTSLISLSVPAHAIVELRASYGFNTVSPSDLNNSSGMSATPVKLLTGFGVDALVSPPLFPLGFGIRYESLSQSLSAGSFTAAAKSSRVALLVDYRVLDTLVFLGAIGSYGISHTTTFQTTILGASDTFTAGSTSSYSIGVEAGLKLIGFIVGAEAGYESLVGKSMSDPAGNTFSGNADLSGVYGKILLGWGF